MTDSETTKRQKISTVEELLQMMDQVVNGDLSKFNYQDLRHVRNSLRKALREAGLR